MWHVVADFDGTVTREDVTVILLNHFTGDRWQQIEDDLDSERIGTREAVRREFELIGAPREAMLEVAEREAEMDPDFPSFVTFARERGIGIEIMSEGLDFYAARLLRAWGVDVPLRTNRAVWEDGAFRIEYPYADNSCTLCGACKMGRVLQLKAGGDQVAYVGDGHSDLCPAVEAHAVFAKGHLARLCDREEIPFEPYDTFADVQRVMAAW
jgi:2,3-diketo-5-methylthio-1-phosphopentane phosphatase